MGCFVFVFLFFLVSPGCPSPCQDGFFFSFFSTLMFAPLSPPLTSSQLQLWNYSTMPPLVIVGRSRMAGFTFFFFSFLSSFIFLLFNFFSSKLSGTVCNVTWYQVACDMSDNVIDLTLVLLCFLLSLHPFLKNQYSLPKNLFHSTKKSLFLFTPLIYFILFYFQALQCSGWYHSPRAWYLYRPHLHVFILFSCERS